MDRFEGDTTLLDQAVPGPRWWKWRSGILPAVLAGSAIGMSVGLALAGGLQFLLQRRQPKTTRETVLGQAVRRQHVTWPKQRGVFASPAGDAAARRGAQANSAFPAAQEDAPPPPIRRNSPRRPQPTGNPLDDAIGALASDAETTGLAEHVGVYLAPAEPGRPAFAGFRSDEDFPAASVIKIPVMLAVEQSWSDHPARRTTAQSERLERMIRYSDNEAANALVQEIGGFEPVNEEVRRLLRVPQTTTRLASYLHGTGGSSRRPKNRACPREIGQLLCAISEGEETGDEHAREMLGVMRRTSAEHRTRIPQGIPLEYRPLVANKTGTLNSYPVVNDAAIIETPAGSRYVLCIFMEGVRGQGAADAFCEKLSCLCWKSLSGPGLTAVERRHSNERGVRLASGRPRRKKGEPNQTDDSTPSSRPSLTETRAAIKAVPPAPASSTVVVERKASESGSKPALSLKVETDTPAGDPIHSGGRQ